VGVVVIPSVYGISPESFDLYPFRPGDNIYLRPDFVERFEFINKIAQAVTVVALLSTPRGQDFEFVEFMADEG
jgi:hypothetical protein